MQYLHTDETKINDFSSDFIDEMYEKGYVFTRIDKGVMHQTRSIRIDLGRFSPSSENRRIIKKTEGLGLSSSSLPFSEYDWSIGKMAKDFYTEKFGGNIMSAQKVKEMMTDSNKSNFNTLLSYTFNNETSGYTICYKSNNIIHYSYPFYNLEKSPKDMGMGMMIRAIIHAQESGMKYIYLGSLQRPTDTYKLQFTGIQWFDGTGWSEDIEKIKTILADKK